MSLSVDAILIDEIEFGNTKEKSRIYIAKISYKDLNSVCKFGNVSINREVDDDRAAKMVEYIEKKDSFYPTIVVATNKKNLIEYDENKKTIQIKIKDDEEKFIVLDGQHRFKSINLLLKEKECDINKFQSVFIIENMNNFQQRKVFLDINDTPRRVTTGTKLRFDKTIANYFSLSFLDENCSVLKYILMDDNQTSTNNKIPYKYIIKFNEKLISILSKNFKNNKITFEEVEKYKNDIVKINNMLDEIIKKSQQNDYQITKYELFYTELGDLLGEYIKDAFDNKKDIEMKKIGKCMASIKKCMNEISGKFMAKVPKGQKEKKETIKGLLKEVESKENVK